MTDRELLEFAAKAAGYVIEDYRADGSAWVYPVGEIPDEDGDYDGLFLWRPKDDDGDALRLAVKLDLELLLSQMDESPRWISALKKNTMIHAAEDFSLVDQQYAATRRAIVRAAAEIGKHAT